MEALLLWYSNNTELAWALLTALVPGLLAHVKALIPADKAAYRIYVGRARVYTLGVGVLGTSGDFASLWTAETPRSDGIVSACWSVIPFLRRA